MNDPDSVLKTAAYISTAPKTVPHGEPVLLAGTAMSGRTPLGRVEYWVRPVEPLLVTGELPALPDDAPELLNASWHVAELQAAPLDWEAALPDGASTGNLFGFDSQASGQPVEWPFRFGHVGWSARIEDLPPGEYELRARAVDVAGNKQPEPRPQQKNGKNAIQMRRVAVQ